MTVPIYSPNLAIELLSLFMLAGMFILLITTFCKKNLNRDDWNTIKVFGTMFVVFGLFVAAIQWIIPSAQKKTPYEVVSTGVYDHAEYSSSGGLISRGFTTIHLKNGQTYVLDGRHNVTLIKGTKVQISENKFFVKIEGVE